MAARAFYELPLGKGKIREGWSISSILILQTGPWLTPTFTNGDPSGTGATRHGSQRPDRIASGWVEDPDEARWLDRAAFVCPGRTAGALQSNCSIGVVPGRDSAPIARFGNSGVGILEGPGTAVWNAGLSKRLRLGERAYARIETTFTNVLNRSNLGDPILDITNNDFGRITTARASDFGGGRTGQAALRIEF
jgi:hypothetical protein